MQRFIILDGNAILHRAWHALPPLTTPKGMVINAAYGFTSLLLKIIKEYKPTHLAVAFDRKEPTFRHKLFKEYKAQRIKQPQELYDQIPVIKDILALFHIPVYEAVGYEADDVIATLATLANKSPLTLPSPARGEGIETLIVTGDRDALQLVTDTTSVVLLKKGISEVITHTPATVQKEYGFPPEQLRELKALAGDASDNIPGVEGVGEKTALKVLQHAGTLQKLQAMLKEGVEDDVLKGKLRERLMEAKDRLTENLTLVTLVHDVPLEFFLERTAWGEFDHEGVKTKFLELGFRTLVGKIPGMPLTQTLPREGGGVDKKSSPSTGEEKGEGDIQSFLVSAQRHKEFAMLPRMGKANLFGSAFEGLDVATADGTWLIPSSALSTYSAPFRDSNILKVGHDIKALFHVLKAQGVPLTPPYFDTMLAEYLITPGRRNYPLDGGVEALLPLQKQLQAQLAEYHIEKLLFDLELPLIPVLASMEEAGILLDKKYLGVLSHTLHERLTVLEKDIWASAGTQFNIASPLQLREVLFEKLKLPTKGIGHGKTGLSTDADTLEKLQGTHAVIPFILEHRELSKLTSTYVDVLPGLTDKAGRIHTTFNQTIAATGRLSSINPNLQNIPVKGEWGKEIRKAFVAPSGTKLVALDYSQIELRVVAHLSHDRVMVAAFQDGEDIHNRTAAELFKVKPDEVTKDMRRMAKTINFGVLYGMGSNSLASTMGIKREEAQNFIDDYFNGFAGLAEYLRETKEQAHALGYVETLFGRRRYLPELTSGMPYLRAEAERQAINHPVQGTAADIMKMAMLEVTKKLKEFFSHPERSEGSRQQGKRDSSPTAQNDNSVRMLLQVHDELVFEVDEPLVEEVIPLIKSAMESVAQLRVPLVVDAKVGDNWGEMLSIAL